LLQAPAAVIAASMLLLPSFCISSVVIENLPSRSLLIVEMVNVSAPLPQKGLFKRQK